MDVLLDTHAWVWMLTNDPNLTDAARQAAKTADVVRLSPVSVFEVAQKVRVGKWPDMEPYVDDLPQLIEGQGILMATLTPRIATLAGHMPWPHRDPFDRLIAATALTTGATLLSADTMFDTLEPTRLQRVW
ncbi:MAG: type II toxin-antitoxin system VapC family toxin [Pseudomonadota bacterium]